MFHRFLVLLFVSAFFASSVEAQITYGFKAGASFRTMLGPLERDSVGNKLESNHTTFGFMAGGMIKFAITDKIGIEADVLFSQKGSSYKYQGPSYPLPAPYNTSGDSAFRKLTLSISNSYIEIPVLFYYKAKKWTFSAGPSIAFLITSKAQGNLQYYDADPRLKKPAPYNTRPHIEFDIEADYFKDNKESAAVSGSQNILNIVSPTIIDGYYLETSKLPPYYNILDMGAILDATYTFNGSFSMGLRADVGLLDVTNSYYDVSKYKRNADKTYIHRNDFDRNLAIQVYLQFGFGKK